MSKLHSLERKIDSLISRKKLKQPSHDIEESLNTRSQKYLQTLEYLSSPEEQIQQKLIDQLVSKTVQRARQRDQVKMFDADIVDIKLRKSSPRKQKRKTSIKKSKSPKKLYVKTRNSPSKASSQFALIEIPRQPSIVDASEKMTFLHKRSESKDRDIFNIPINNLDIETIITPKTIPAASPRAFLGTESANRIKQLKVRIQDFPPLIFCSLESIEPRYS